MLETLGSIFQNNGLIVSFAIVGFTMYLSYFISDKLTKGRIHGSAIAITLGLLLAYIGGVITGGEKGIADISLFTGIGLMGGGMLRDFAIVATAFGANFSEIKKAGVNGVLSLFIGVILSFIIGVCIALAFGYKDAVSLTTIGAGTATYIVGPVTGTAIGASSEVITISIAAGLVKSILTMIGTPFVAKYIGLNNPRTAMVYGGLMGTTSGVAGGLAATDPKLVPYGAVTATFYTGLGCLLGPSVLFLITKAIFA
ncbi:malonate transporter subunit MadM [Bacillus sp. ISL-40]|uniref:malonate transporter subunit MadM n=1 Tax=unclassified Bacillus (in: firmicutes) TaxID=185979 RepID=UPI001BE532E2|nr:MULTISPECIES: malonate transporter subunit MadM [unclassified Bacillus (in: firmicutes)]MBT2698432.1 malonate transporter subunit MadM [Bacillus sp. ISL-40]MBT2722129.1 malonate transporter subunit MadM [Bacillus sp. ISL-46]MBT2740582.1 malonate transporter subunit MadM [Bacillus sp. ISL-77]